MVSKYGHSRDEVTLRQHFYQKLLQGVDIGFVTIFLRADILIGLLLKAQLL